MKMRNLALASAVALGGVGMTAVSAPAEAGVSGNIGVMSKYYFRGILEADQATGFGGVDYEHSSGLYVGTWLADLGDMNGIEYDIYGGWAGEFGGLSVLVGITTYNYTEGDRIDEVNLGLGYDFGGPFVDIEFSAGEVDDDLDEDYTFLGVTVGYDALSLTYGTFGSDAEGDYFELGYSVSVADQLDVDFALGYADEDLAGGMADEYVMVTLTRGFDLF